MWGGGFPNLGVPTIMENQMEKNMENDMKTAVAIGLSVQAGLSVSRYPSSTLFSFLYWDLLIKAE